MGTNLETLILEFRGDFSQLDASLERASQKALQTGKKIEGIILSPSVDHSSLSALNKHLDLKVKHLNEVRAYFKRNPIILEYAEGNSTKVFNRLKGGNKVAGKLNFAQEVNQAYHSYFNADVDRLKTPLLAIAAEVSQGFQSANALSKNVSSDIRGVTTAVRSLKPSLLGRVVGTVARAGVDSVFNAATDKFASGLVKAASNSSISGKIEQASELVYGGILSGVDKLTDSISRDLLGFNGKEPALKMAAAIGKAFENGLDPKFISQSFQNNRRYFIRLGVAVEQGAMSMEEAVKEVFEAFHDAHKNFLHNAIDKSSKVAGFPLLVKNELELERAAGLIHKVSQNLNFVAKSLGKHRELKNLDGVEQVIVTSAGFQKTRGKSSQETTEMVRPYFEEKTTRFVEIKNTDTDRYSGTMQSKYMYDAVVGLLGEEVGQQLGGALKETLSELEVQIDKAFTGVDRDAIKMATIGHFIKQVNPNINVAGLGFSGGGFPVKQFVELMQRLGHANTKGVAIGTPITNTTATPTKNFKSLVGMTDEQSFLYDKEEMGVTPEVLARMQNGAKSVASQNAIEQAKYAPLDVPEEVYISPSGITHDVFSYMMNDDTYNEMAEIMPGMKKLEKNVKVAVDSLEGFEEISDLISQINDPIQSAGKAGQVNKPRMFLTRMALSNRFFDSKDVKNGDVSDELDRLGSIPKKERTKKEEEKFSRLISNLFEQFGNAENFSRALTTAIKGDFKKQAKDLGANKEQLAQVDKFAEQYAAQLIARYSKKDDPKLKAALSRAADVRLQEVGVDINDKRIQKLEANQKLALATFVSKRNTDDPKFKHSLDNLRTKGNSELESDYQFFNFEDPIKKANVETGGMINYVVSRLQSDLKGTEFEEVVNKWASGWYKLEAGAKEFLRTGKELPQEFFEEIFELLDNPDKLDATTKVSTAIMKAGERDQSEVKKDQLKDYQPQQATENKTESRKTRPVLPTNKKDFTAQVLGESKPNYSPSVKINKDEKISDVKITNQKLDEIAGILSQIDSKLTSNPTTEERGQSKSNVITKADGGVDTVPQPSDNRTKEEYDTAFKILDEEATKNSDTIVNLSEDLGGSNKGLEKLGKTAQQTGTVLQKAANAMDKVGEAANNLTAKVMVTVQPITELVEKVHDEALQVEQKAFASIPVPFAKEVLNATKTVGKATIQGQVMNHLGVLGDVQHIMTEGLDGIIDIATDNIIDRVMPEGTGDFTPHHTDVSHGNNPISNISHDVAAAIKDGVADAVDVAKDATKTAINDTLQDATHRATDFATDVTGTDIEAYAILKTIKGGTRFAGETLAPTETLKNQKPLFKQLMEQHDKVSSLSKLASGTMSRAGYEAEFKKADLTFRKLLIENLRLTEAERKKLEDVNISVTEAVKTLDFTGTDPNFQKALNNLARSLDKATIKVRTNIETSKIDKPTNERELIFAAVKAITRDAISSKNLVNKDSRKNDGYVLGRAQEVVEAKGDFDDALASLKQIIKKSKSLTKAEKEQLTKGGGSVLSQAKASMTRTHGVATDLLANAEKMGYEINRGLDAGIKKNAGMVNQSMAKTAQGLIDIACQIFDIHSPSREFIKIGRFLVEGLENGADFDSATSGMVNDFKSFLNEMEAAAEQGIELDDFMSHEKAEDIRSGVLKKFRDFAYTTKNSREYQDNTSEFKRLVEERSTNDAYGAKKDKYKTEEELNTPMFKNPEVQALMDKIHKESNEAIAKQKEWSSEQEKLREKAQKDREERLRLMDEENKKEAEREKKALEEAKKAKKRRFGRWFGKNESIANQPKEQTDLPKSTTNEEEKKAKASLEQSSNVRKRRIATEEESRRAEESLKKETQKAIESRKRRLATEEESNKASEIVNNIMPGSTEPSAKVEPVVDKVPQPEPVKPPKKRLATDSEEAKAKELLEAANKAVVDNTTVKKSSKKAEEVLTKETEKLSNARKKRLATEEESRKAEAGIAKESRARLGGQKVDPVLPNDTNASRKRLGGEKRATTQKLGTDASRDRLGGEKVGTNTKLGTQAARQRLGGEKADPVLPSSNADKSNAARNRLGAEIPKSSNNIAPSTQVNKWATSYLQIGKEVLAQFNKGLDLGKITPEKVEAFKNLLKRVEEAVNSGVEFKFDASDVNLVFDKSLPAVLEGQLRNQFSWLRDETLFQENVPPLPPKPKTNKTSTNKPSAQTKVENKPDSLDEKIENYKQSSQKAQELIEETKKLLDEADLEFRGAKNPFSILSDWFDVTHEDDGSTDDINIPGLGKIGDIKTKIAEIADAKFFDPMKGNDGLAWLRGADRGIGTMFKEFRKIIPLINKDFVNGLTRAGILMAGMAANTLILGTAAARMTQAFSSFVTLPIDMVFDKLGDIQGAVTAAKKYAIELANIRRIESQLSQKTGKEFDISSGLANLDPVVRDRSQNFIATSGEMLAASGFTDESIQDTGRKLGEALRYVDPETGNNAARAINQMLGKGKIQAEELRGQLSEAIPGASQKLADALGVSNDKLYDMAANGELGADAVRILVKELANASNSMNLDPATKSFIDFENSLTVSQRKIGEAAIVTFKPFFDFSNGLPAILENVGAINSVLTMMLSAVTAVALRMGLSALKSYALRQGLLTAASAAKVLAQSAALTVGRLLAITAAIEGIRGVHDVFINIREKDKDSVKKIREAFGDGEKKENQGKDADRQKLLGYRQQSSNWALNAVDNLLNAPGDLINRLAKNKVVGTVGFSAFEQRNQKKGANEIDFESDKYTQQVQETLNKELPSLKVKFDLNKEEIEKLEAKKIAINLDPRINSTDKQKQTQEITKQLNDLLTDRDELLNALSTDGIDTVISENEAKLQELKALRDNNNMTELQPEIDKLVNNIAEAKRVKTELENAAKEFTKVETSKVSRAISDAANQYQVNQTKNNKNSIARNIENLQNTPVFATQQFNLNRSQNSVKDAEDKLRSLETRLKSLGDISQSLNKSERADIESILGKTIDKATQEDYLRAKSAIESKGDDSGVSDGARKFIESSSELAVVQNEVSQAQADLLQAQRDAAISERDYENAIRDLTIQKISLQQSIEDFIRNTGRQEYDMAIAKEDFAISFSRQIRDFQEGIDDYGRELERNFISSQNELNAAKRRLKNADLNLMVANSTGALTSDNIGKQMVDRMKEFAAIVDEAGANQDNVNLQRLEIEQQAIEVARRVRGFQEQAEDMERQRMAQVEQLRRTQEDFNVQQHRQWQEILNRGHDINKQASELGIGMDQIGTQVVNQGGALVAAVHEIATRLVAASSSIPVGFEGGSPGGTSSSGAVVFPIAGKTADQNLPGAGGMPDATRSGGRRHGKIDYQYATGTPVVAAMGGEVIMNASDKGEFGVKIKTLNAKGEEIIAHYFHLHESLVKVGQKIEAGQKIGTVGGDKGSWGSTGAHLDYGMQVAGKFIDPREFHKNPAKYGMGGSQVNTTSSNHVGASGSFSSEKAANIIASRLSQAGYNKYSQAAMLGGLQQESGFNPHIVQGGKISTNKPGAGVGYGMAQWTDAGRQANMPKPTGDWVKDLNNQIDYMIEELNTSYKSTGNKLRNARNLQEANSGMKDFEGYGIAGNRYKYADQWMNKINSGSIGSSTESVSSGTPMTPVMEASKVKVPSLTPIGLQSGNVLPFTSSVNKLLPALAENTQALRDTAQQTIDNRQATTEAEKEAQKKETEAKLKEFAKALELDGDALKKSILDVGETARSVSLQAEAALLNAKGYLTNAEQAAQAGRDVSENYRSQMLAIAQQRLENQNKIEDAKVNRENTIKIFEENKKAAEAQGTAIPEETVKAHENLIKTYDETIAAFNDAIAVLNDNYSDLNANKEEASQIAEDRKMRELNLSSRTEATSLNNGLLSTIASDADPITAMGINAAIKIDEITIKYAQLEEQLRKLGETGDISGEKLAQMSVNMEKAKEVDLKNAWVENNQAAQAFNTFLGDLIKGSKSAGEALRDFALSLVDLAAQWATMQLTKAIFGALGGAFGGGGGSVGSALVTAFAYDGGEVKNFAKGGAIGKTKGLDAAIARERAGAPGKNPVVAVLHEGEQVLSTLNGDAQAFRAMQRSGDWAEMKASRVGNFASGGMVGCYSDGGMVKRGTSQQSTTSQPITVVNNYSFKGADADSFRRSRRQLDAMEESRTRRAFDRNR